MLTIAYYFLQVVLCSGLMMGYYLLVLRNKRFHQYNRFYLLAVLALSWIIPLIKIRWGHPVVSEDQQMIRLLAIVADSNSQMEESITQQGFQWTWGLLITGIYFMVAVMLFTGMIAALVKVYQLLKYHSCRNIEDVYLILTNAKGTPFSFFRYIFWNEAIDMSSESGKQILKHELTHVRQKHSIDKIFIQLVLVAGWFNPFFWLLKKEMEMIHEFIADKKAIVNGNTASLAEMLLTAAYPQQKLALTHPFFFSPIRRRLAMLSNNKDPRFSYIRRAVVLPLLGLVIILFSFRNKIKNEDSTVSVASVMENIAEAVNKRMDAGSLQLKEANELGKSSMIRLMIEGKLDTSKASDHIKDIRKLAIAAVSDASIATDTVTPAITQPIFMNWKTVKSNMPNGVVWIVDGRKMDMGSFMDTLTLKNLNPDEISEVKILNAKDAENLYGIPGANGVIEVITKSFVKREEKLKDLLVMVDGVKYAGSLESINANDIRVINVLKDKSSIEKYGEEARNGVIEIETIPGKQSIQPGAYQMAAKTEVPGFYFNGGNKTWEDYLWMGLNSRIRGNEKKLEKGKFTFNISFDLTRDGSPINVNVTSEPENTILVEALSEVISNSPKWLPTIGKDVAIRSVYKQTIALVVVEDRDGKSIFPGISHPGKRNYFYMGLSKPMRPIEENSTEKAEVLYTDIKKIYCEEADLVLLTEALWKKVQSVCRNKNGCTSDLNSYPSYGDAIKVRTAFLSRYGDDSKYERKKLDFNPVLQTNKP